MRGANGLAIILALHAGAALASGQCPGASPDSIAVGPSVPDAPAGGVPESGFWGRIVNSAGVDYLQYADYSCGTTGQKKVIINVPVSSMWHASPRVCGCTLNANNYTAASAPAITVDLVDYGFDVHFEFHNSSLLPQFLGTIRIPEIETGYQPYRRNVEDGTETLGAVIPSLQTYPGELYSPVYVIHCPHTESHWDNNFNVLIDDPEPACHDYHYGISLLYDVVGFRHDVVRHVFNSGPGITRCEFMLNNDCTNPLGGDPAAVPQYPELGLLQPSETRTYTLAFRAARNGDLNPSEPHNWMRVIEPYRKHFQTLYGSTRYAKDSRPVAGMSVAQDGVSTTGNPFMFNSERPDLYGWGNWQATLDNAVQNHHWPRSMLWAPSGWYPTGYTNRANYAFCFTSHWDDSYWTSPPYGHLDETGPLKAHAEAFHGLGLWWGRSTEPRETWDSASEPYFDPSDTTIRGYMLREIDGAAAVSVATVGLDQFGWDQYAVDHQPSGVLPAWLQYIWLRDLTNLYPKIKFVTESHHSDLFHTIAANFYRPEVATAATEVLMADFLTPNHESWAQLVDDAPGLTTSQEVALVASKGLVACRSYWNDPSNVLTAPASQYEAIDSRPNTVPSDQLTAYYPTISAPLTLTPSEFKRGDSGTMSVTAQSPRNLPMTVTWYRWTRDVDGFVTRTEITNGGGCTISTNSSGNTITSDLTIGTVTASHYGVYRAVVTEGDGPAYSLPVVLDNLRCWVDWNGDGALTNDDVSAFTGDFYSSPPPPETDFNHDGLHNPDDLSDFITAYFLAVQFGCP